MIPIMNQPAWVLEKYITDHALPHERILSWIKWNPTIPVEKIIFKTEADVVFPVILNVSEEGLRNNEAKDGEITIEKQFIQIQGFIGFVAEYDKIPETSRKVNFLVDLITKEDTVQIELTTNIIRPELYMEGDQRSIIVSGSTPIQIYPLNFKLNNRSKAFAAKLELVSHFTPTKNVQIKIENIVSKIKDENLLFVETNDEVTSKIFVRGQGYCMISIGYEYEDRIGNKYKTNLIDVAINLEQKTDIEIPLSNDVSGNNEELTLKSEKEPLLQPIIVR